MDGCRNCGAKVKNLGFIGEVAPFILSRVMDLEVAPARAVHPVKRLLHRIRPLRRAAQKIYGPAVFTQIQICLACSFVQTREPLPEPGLARLYADYRAESYNRDRIRYEPHYAAIAAQVGSSQQEIDNRVNSLTAWLSPRLNAGSSFSMLDYGGADGRFLPRLAGRKYVYDISQIEPAAGVERIWNQESLGTYSYVQLAHVLEHVPFPLDLTRKAASYLEPAGHLYVEVPQDLSNDFIAQLARDAGNARVPIHEHINFYCASSAEKLLTSAGLRPVAVETAVVDLGWIKANIVRALGQKI